ncbi:MULTISPECIES: D-2-hydroxyacid dehydrogenase [Thioalkalivibrio]|uniref:D-2-hydroxyacid dehydrogenase n=1 Tax=Thioalkalivibrio TaxID=106633 RepID=UPI00036C42A5|nr:MULTISPECIES: D-2-hydroxyacid dehydrogenase [Thioalkalivibrio]OOC48921.1 D-2-hydroxyacid dehydrogenase [Thioalkalivibrio versutus]
MRLSRTLFLQKPDVLRQQQGLIESRLCEAFPNTALTFAGGPDAVPEGLEVDAVIAPTLPWLPEALNRLSRYQWIHFLSAGVERIWDMPFPKDGLMMTKSSGVHGAPMSEYAIGAMLYFAKHFDRFNEQSRQKRWERSWLGELTGRTVMVLGMGHIGALVARRAQAFDMRVIGVQRNPRAHDHASEVIPLDAVEKRLSEVDYLVVCLPLTPGTHHLVAEPQLQHLKPGAVLVDISRGGVVDQRALTQALDTGHLRGAALDVFEEQPLPAGSSLWNRENVLVTPHVSGTSPHYMERALEIFVRNARALEQGHAPITPVDPAAGY